MPGHCLTTSALDIDGLKIEAWFNSFYCFYFVYRKDALASCNGDHPLIIQFCANDADALLEAALIAQDHCDAIDLNLGCPQVVKCVLT